MKKNLRFALAILTLLSMTLFVVSGLVSAHLSLSNAVSSSTSGAQHWKEGDAFPVVNGHIVYPTIPPSDPAPNWSAHWYAGCYFSESQGSQNASVITTNIDVPDATPLSDEFYYVLLSAFDSNGSYNQLGYSNCWGTWGLTYSWTFNDSSGHLHYIYDPCAVVLSSGVTYEFDITTEGQHTVFDVFEGSTLIFTDTAPTGGNYLFLNSSLTDVTPYDYTAYEEIWYTHTPGGAPGFNFYFHDQHWTATNGSSYRPEWVRFTANAPSGIDVLVDGGDVYIWNPNVVPSQYPVNVGVSSIATVPPHYSPFQVYHNSTWYNGASLLMTYNVTIRRFDLHPVITVLAIEIDLIRTNLNNASDYRVINTTQTLLSSPQSMNWLADWNETSTMMEGNWTISASTKVLTSYAFDMNSDDDELAADTVWAKVLIGDIDGSGLVNILDAIRLSSAYGSKPGGQYWNPDADIKNDGIVNILDAVLLGFHFNWNINGPPGKMPSGGGGFLATGATTVQLNPSQITAFKGEVFSVNVTLSNVADLYGWEFKLYWNSTVLNCTSAVVQTPTEWQNNSQIVASGLQADYNCTHSLYWQGEYALYPACSFNGGMTLATLTFQALQTGTTSLTLTDVILGNSMGEQIVCTATSGSVTVYYGRYMRSDTVTVNGLNAYFLNATETTSYTYVQKIGQGEGPEYGIRAWLRAPNGTEYEVTLDGQTGTPKATVTSTGWGTVDVTQKSMQTTFSLVVRVYISIAGGAWTNVATFTTEQLGKTSLTGTTWSVYYYVSATYNAKLDRTTAKFYWGDATHMSRIQNLQFS